MEDTWAKRDLPVLDAVVELFDECPGNWLLGQQVVERTGMDRKDVERAVSALSPDYVILGQQMAADGDIGTQVLESVTAEARRVVGQWPTGKRLVEQLAAGIAQAAERETDPEQKSRLRAIASGLVGVAKTIAVNVASEMIEHRLSH